MSLSTQDGRVVATGDDIQIADGDKITSHLVFHFKDGSVDDETTVFTQHEEFKLISEHHVQKGPFFPHPMDLAIDVASGEVTVKTTQKDGKEFDDTEHMDMPADLANGLVNAIVKNLKPERAETKISMIVPTPKPRLVALAISPRGEESFLLAGARRKALAYEIKIELGGVAGVVAQFVGRQPPNVHLWILGGELPTFLREEGQSFEDGPILVMSLVSPTWPHAARPSAKPNPAKH